MPFKARRPAGGFRVMYEYANRLSDLGYRVHITYPIKTRYMEYRLPYLLRLCLSYIEGFRTNRWFDFRSDISMSYAKSVEDKYIQDADVVIATWWTTVLEVGSLSPSKGKKINLIQGYENWTGREDELYSSYNIPTTTNVVVASYIETIVKQHTNNRVVLIPNAIDKERYRIIIPVEDRESATICMMYSIQEIKGSNYGLEAVKKIKDVYPSLKVELFGVCPQPDGLPDWIRFYRDPNDINALYNGNAIFVSNSFTEGMALTPMEAMFCGCACILTDIDGHSEYAKDNETALLYKVKNVDQLVDKIVFLLDNITQRITLAQRGNAFIQQFSWDVAVAKMDAVIKQLIDKR